MVVLDASDFVEEVKGFDMPTDEVCIKPEKEPTWYYANFVNIDLSPGEIEPQILSSTGASATAGCAKTDVACRQFYGPEPASSFALQSDPATGNMLLLHPVTGDWWQYDSTSASTKWVRNNGYIQGRDVSVTPKAATSFFASAFIEATGKFVVCGGGFQDGNSWGNQCPGYPIGPTRFYEDDEYKRLSDLGMWDKGNIDPCRISPELIMCPDVDCTDETDDFGSKVPGGTGKFMELDLDSGRFTDIEDPQIVEVFDGAVCSMKDTCKSKRI